MKKKIIKAIAIIYGSLMGIGLVFAGVGDSDNETANATKAKAGSNEIVQEVKITKEPNNTESEDNKKIGSTEKSKANEEDKESEKKKVKASEKDKESQDTKGKETRKVKSSQEKTINKIEVSQEAKEKMTIYLNLATDEPEYTMHINTLNLIKKSPELFPVSNYNKIKRMVDNNITFKHINKTPAKYANKIMKFSNYKVDTIREIENVEGKYTLSIIYAEEYNNVQNYACIYYLGKLDNVFEDSIISCYGVPAGLSSFSNVSGGTTNCCVVLGNYIEDYKNLESFVTAICSFSDPPELEENEYDEYFRGEYDYWLEGKGYYNIKQKKDGTFYCTD